MTSFITIFSRFKNPHSKPPKLRYSYNSIKIDMLYCIYINT